jgi:hypothetical protein
VRADRRVKAGIVTIMMPAAHAAVFLSVAAMLDYKPQATATLCSSPAYTRLFHHLLQRCLREA